MKQWTFFAAVALCASATLPNQAAAQDKGAPPPALAARPLHAYHVMYTLTETDGGKKVSVQHYTLSVNSDNRPSEAKLGSKVPIATGANQVQYLDVGLSVTAQLDEGPAGVQLHSKIEQSSILDGNAALGQPVIRQATATIAALLKPGQSVSVGSLDIPGSTRHLEIEVRMELID